MAVTQQEDQKFVTFKLEDEFYALDVNKIQEVVVPTSITQIPQAAEYIAGVINYRGTILTVVDLKKRLVIPTKNKSGDGSNYQQDIIEDRLYVIIVKSGDTQVGLLVDSVEAVININKNSIKSSLELISAGGRAAFLVGVARTELGLTVLLSIETILSEYEISEAEKLALMEGGILDNEDEELVLTGESIVDLEEDDLSATDNIEETKSKFKKVDVQESDLGESPLNLSSLTKAELLKIAIEMEISDVTTRTVKNELVKKIQEKMSG